MSFKFNLCLLIYLLNISIAPALKIKINPLIMMKEMKSVITVESLFQELTSINKKPGNSKLKLLAVFLRNPSFEQQYIKFCKTYSIYNFLCLGLQASHPSLDASRIFSPDCIAASGAKFISFEEKLVPFLQSKNSNPVLSNNFKPSQWSINQFIIFLNDAMKGNSEIDWTAWCGDVDLSSDHFNYKIWDDPVNGNDLWKFLNYKCIERMTIQSKRIMSRSRYLTIFKPQFTDTQNQLLMKIINLSAAQINLKYFNQGALHEFVKNVDTIKNLVASLLRQLVKKKKGDPYSTSISRTTAILVKNCGIATDILPYVSHSSQNILSEIYRFLKDDPTVNDSWLLNLIYLMVNVQQILLSDHENQITIKWFFDLNPSIPNICQLLEIIGLKRNQKFRKLVLEILNSDGARLSKVYWQCPKFINSPVVPLNKRIQLILKRKRMFPSRSLRLKVLQRERNQFWSLVQLIKRFETPIFSHNTAIFETGFDLATFRGLDHFFEHFLDCFLNNPVLYHIVAYSEEAEQKPIIVPSLVLPMKMLKLLFSVLARAAILDFKVPFYIHFDFFASAHNHNVRGHLIEVHKLKRMFYKNRNLADATQISTCEHINVEADNDQMFLEHLQQVCTKLTSPHLVLDSSIVNILEWQLVGIHSALNEMFPKEIYIEMGDLYSFIFNRNIINKI